MPASANAIWPSSIRRPQERPWACSKKLGSKGAVPQIVEQASAHGTQVEVAGGDDDLPAGRQMTLQWIATRLQMGTGASLSNLLSAQRRGQG